MILMKASMIYCCRSNPSLQRGFSLLEMAVVMVILGLLLGGLLGPLSEQRKNKLQTQAKQQLIDIESALLGYAAAYGKLPCPATNASAGVEARTGSDNCSSQFGYPPAQTLGLQGRSDSSGRILDPWLAPIRYSLSSVNTWEYAKAIELNGSSADYQICAQSSCSNVQAQNVVAVLISLGEDGISGTTSPDQLENTDGDSTFVSRSLSEASGSEFNDNLRWISSNVLVFQLVNAGRL